MARCRIARPRLRPGDGEIINLMKIVVLDGFTLNPGDLDWAGLRVLGDCSAFESSRRAPSRIPKGFHHLAQGCESASYPGLRPVWPHNSEGVASNVVCPARRDSTPSELMKLSNRKPSVARRTRNAGLNDATPSGLQNLPPFSFRSAEKGNYQTLCSRTAPTSYVFSRDA